MNEPWRLESFVDALVVELDKTRETLSVKAINQPLSYTVKDMSLDLQIFPTYTGDEVTFTTAQPGEAGSSKISLQLAAITDRQVRESSKRPVDSSDVDLDSIPIDSEVKRQLRKVGVRSVNDLQRMEDRNVKLESVVRKKVDYSGLAETIRSARRSSVPPVVKGASLAPSTTGQVFLRVFGEHLAVEPSFRPVVTVNNHVVGLVSFHDGALEMSVPLSVLRRGDNEVVLVLDPYSVARLVLRTVGEEAA